MKNSSLIKKILTIENDIKQFRKNNNLFYYNSDPEKIHAKQLEFHKSQKRNRWVFGGNRSGKTECGAAEAVYMARGNHPFRKNRDNVAGWVVSLSTQVQRDVAQAKILHYINPEWIEDIVMQSGRASSPKGGVIDYILIKNIFGGTSKIGFKSCEMDRDKFAGASLDFVWFDEEPPKDIYDECRMRVIDRCGDIFGTMTPLLGLTFVYNKIYLNEDGDDDVWHIHMEWADNPWLDKREVEKITKAMSHEEIEARRYGNFSSSKGLVYSEFNERIHVIEPFEVPKEWFDNISIDPGLNNPTSVHWYAADFDGTVYVIAEHYEARKTVKEHANAIKSISEGLGWHSDGRGRYSALIDSAAGQRTLANAKSVKELFYDEGIVTNSAVNKDLFYGINKVKQYLKLHDEKPSLYIFNTCKNLIREIKQYFWASNDVPKKKDDHALDEMRYYLCSRQDKVGDGEQKSDIQLHKEKLIRKRRRRV